MKRNSVVGIFVIVGLALFTAGLFLIGNRHEAFTRHVEYYADFIDLSGLSNGSNVRVAGMDAGQVVAIEVPGSPASRFRVKFRIAEKFAGLVRVNSVATIGTEGVVGDVFLTVRPGSAAAAAAKPLTTLQTKEPTEISDLLDQGRGLLTDVDGTVKTTNGAIKQINDEIGTTLHKSDVAISNVNDVVVGIKEGRGTAGLLISDKTLPLQIQQTMRDVQSATANLDSASAQVKGLVNDLNARSLPAKADDALVSVRSAAANIDVTSQQIRTTVAEMSGPDQQGVTAGANLRETLSNTNEATANMADETEALKHNFFFKGFFQHRGYFNLAHLSPDLYRSDKLFTTPADKRFWFTAADVFASDQTGGEQLSQHGKSLLDDALAQNAGALGRPIVVEGYSDGSNAGQQLSLSRSRSILVREYLLNHFQLSAGGVGAVALSNVPPQGMGHANWNGVCVVMVKSGK